MRVLWLNHRDIENPASGGAERTIFEISRRLTVAGCQVHLVSCGWPGSRPHSDVEGVHIDRFPGYVGPHLILPRLLHTPDRPDIVVDDLAHVVPWGSPLLSSIPGAVVFRHLHARTLSGQVGPAASWILKRIERSYPIVYRSWPFVTETRRSVLDLVHMGIPESRCRIIRPGVDTDLFKPGAKTTHPLIVYFGGLRPYKRPDHAVKAFARLRSSHADYRMVVIGSGPSLIELRELSSSLGIRDSLTFLGRIETERLADILSTAWVNLHCSTAEGWGSSVLEAAAAGVATVAYRVPGLIESVSEGESGLLVEDNQVERLAAGVEEIVANVSGWSRSSRKHAEQYDWGKATSSWRALFDELVKLPG